MSDSKPKLLVVDDEPMVRTAVKRILQSKFDVIEAGNGFEGVQHFRADPEIRRVLSDGRMPNGSGVEFYQLIVDQLKGRSGRFVIYSAEVPTSWTVYFETQGVRIVEKPTDNDVLRSLFDDMDLPVVVESPSRSE